MRRPWLLDAPPVDLGARPVEVAHLPNRRAAGVLTVFALIWTGVTLWIVAPILGSAASSLPLLAFLLIFPGFGLVTLYGGVAQLVSRRRMRFDGEGVAVDETGPFGRRRWQAPYDAFDGVRVVERRQRRRRGRPDIRWQVLELVHPDASKTLVLATRRGGGPMREPWEAAARALGVPALTEGPDGGTARRPEDLDLTLRQRAAKGETVSGWTPGQPVPSGLAVEERQGADGPQLAVTLKRARLPIWLPLLGLAMGIGVAGASIADGGHPVIGTLIGVVLAAAAVAVAVFDRLKRRRVVVTRQAVRIEEPAPWHGTDEGDGSLDHGAIEDVRLAPARGVAGVVAIEGDRGRLVTGRGLRKRELIWLRDFVAAAVVEA
jgi:hypothetical protein